MKPGDKAIPDARIPKGPVVVVFTCHSCPIAQAYKERIIELSRLFKKEGFSTVGFNANLRERQEPNPFPFPLHFDKSQYVAASFGAVVTPHVFVLDKNHVLQYMGPVDDSETDPKTHYVANAMNYVLMGKTPDPQEVEAYGCRIVYKKYPRL